VPYTTTEVACSVAPTLLAARPRSTVVCGRPTQLLPGGSRWCPSSVLGVAAHESSTCMWSVAASTSDEVDRRATTWGPADLPNKGGCPSFLFCVDGDHPEVGPSSSGRSGEFRKAPPVNVTVQFMTGVCWIGWYSIVCPRAFIPTVWF
jgi:hypothetical protein